MRSFDVVVDGHAYEIRQHMVDLGRDCAPTFDEVLGSWEITKDGEHPPDAETAERWARECGWFTP